jgi:dihydrofolate reductase
MWNIITLDGYFEGKQNWDLSFHEKIWGQELEKLSIEQLHSADSPVILGSGRPLFAQGISSRKLSLVSAQQLETGGVVLKYTK